MQIAQEQKKQYVLQLVHLYSIYLKWFLAEDIYVYSIDEVFIDVTHYLQTYKMRASELITKVIQDVYENIGITATGRVKKIDKFKHIIILDKNKEIQINEIIEILVEKD